jgi:hypothetical protein
MNIQSAIEAMESVTRLHPGTSAEILDAVEAALAERQEYAHRAAAEMIDAFVQYLNKEFDPWQNVNL